MDVSELQEISTRLCFGVGPLIVVPVSPVAESQLMEDIFVEKFMVPVAEAMLTRLMLFHLESRKAILPVRLAFGISKTDSLGRLPASAVRGAEVGTVAVAVL